MGNKPATVHVDEENQRRRTMGSSTPLTMTQKNLQEIKVVGHEVPFICN